MYILLNYPINYQIHLLCVCVFFLYMFVCLFVCVPYIRRCVERARGKSLGDVVSWGLQEAPPPPLKAPPPAPLSLVIRASDSRCHPWPLSTQLGDTSRVRDHTLGQRPHLGLGVTWWVICQTSTTSEYLKYKLPSWTYVFLWHTVPSKRIGTVRRIPLFLL